MKKIIAVLCAATLAVTLTACTNSSKSSNSKNTESAVAKGSASNRKAAKELAKQFNTDGNKAVTTKVETNVVDDQSKDNKAHEVIEVTVVDKDTINTLKKDKSAIDKGTASSDQKMYVASIQDIITKQAKKLNNNNDTIQFGYKEDSDNTILIAGSSKAKDFVTPVTVD